MPFVLFLLITVTVQRVPADVAALADKAGIKEPILASCGAEWEGGRPGGFAVAVGNRDAGGRYIALHQDATAVQLGTFSRKPDLSCYTPAGALKLNQRIAESATIEGGIAPRWRTTVVCGFVDETTAVCWQYSPADARFVEVGGWTT